VIDLRWNYKLPVNVWAAKGLKLNIAGTVYILVNGLFRYWTRDPPPDYDDWQEDERYDEGDDVEKRRSREAYYKRHSFRSDG